MANYCWRVEISLSKEIYFERIIVKHRTNTMDVW